MKGTTTLKLLNPKTGRVEAEIRHDNYLTNFQNALYQKEKANPMLDLGMTSNILFSGYANGVLLFNSARPTSDYILPTSEAVLTGYAGSVYSGDDLKRGTLNLLESGVITSGQRYVWDFGTGLAGGDIAAVALTSQRAADAKESEFPDQINVFTVSGYASGSAVPKKIMSMSDNWILYTESTTFDYANFWIVKNKDPKVIYDQAVRVIATNTNQPNNPSRILNPSLQAVPAGYTRAGVPFVDNTYLYVLHYMAATGVKIHRYDLADNCSYVDELTYGFSYTTVPYQFSLANGYLSWINGSNMQWYKISTDTLSDVLSNPLGITIRAIAPSKLYPNSIMIVSMHSANNNTVPRYSALYVDLATGVLWGRFMFYVSTYALSATNYRLDFPSALYLDEPLVYFMKHTSGSGANHGTGLVSAISPRILATVNNLPSTITKLTTQVLKVIYDITW